MLDLVMLWDWLKTIDWAKWIPSLVALFGFPLTAFLTWWREGKIMKRRFEFEAAVRKETQDRDDMLRAQSYVREDKLIRDRYQDWVSQKWWEKKAETYTKIVESLWHTIDYAGVSEDSILAIRDVPEEEIAIKWKRFKEDKEELRRLSDVGAFVISDEVATALETYFKRTDAVSIQGDEMDWINRLFDAAKDCLNQVRKAALEDLQIKRDLNIDQIT